MRISRSRYFLRSIMDVISTDSTSNNSWIYNTFWIMCKKHVAQESRERFILHLSNFMYDAIMRVLAI